MATDGADEIVFTGGLKIDICRAFGFMGDGVCAIAGSERRLCNFGNIMCSGCEIEFQTVSHHEGLVRSPVLVSNGTARRNSPTQRVSDDELSLSSGSRDVDGQLLTQATVAAHGADEIMLTGSIKSEVCRTCGFMGDGIRGIAGIEGSFGNLRHIMCPSSKFKFENVSDKECLAGGPVLVSDRTV